ncbi:hypothetical protein [Xenorhabdus bovienii]|nr:hypothetical protein [Xenorhabdus bovienii]
MDGAKLAVSIGVASAVKGLVVTPILALGGSLMLVTLGVFAIGILVSFSLYWLDDHFKISETIIKNLKNPKRTLYLLELLQQINFLICWVDIVVDNTSK